MLWTSELPFNICFSLCASTYLEIAKSIALVEGSVQLISKASGQQNHHLSNCIHLIENTWRFAGFEEIVYCLLTLKQGLDSLSFIKN